MKNKWNYETPGICDDMFIRGKVPMTKEEIRAITISKLRLNRNDILIDIGAGTGSISIEAGLILKAGKVYSIERKPEGIELIGKNAKEFGITNIEIIEGEAPEALPEDLLIDKVVIGGTGGKINEIFDWIDSHLKIDGRIVMNFITLENLHLGIDILKKRKYSDIEVIQVSINKGKDIGSLTMLKPQNPIFIISASKR